MQPRFLLVAALGLLLGPGCSIGTATLYDFDGDGSLDADDCNPTDSSINPLATELCDGLDNDCNGSADADELGEVDGDADGWLSCADCDDLDADSYPGAPEVCDGLDNDCSGAADADEVDADKDGTLLCDDDCDDNDPDNYPGNEEACDGADNDCDSIIDEGVTGGTDSDSDGVTDCDGDCDDNDASTFPGNVENCDGIDRDCDGDSSCHLLHVSAGNYHSCGVDPSGAVVCWGIDDGTSNDFGQVRDSPIGTFSQVTSLTGHSCALATDLSVQCWGRNHYDQVEDTPGTDSFVQVSAGGAHNCGIEAGSGQLACWGDANSWQVSAHCDLSNLPAQRVATGNSNTCLLDSSGFPACCGQDDYGESSPPALAMIDVTVGWNHGCGIDTNQQVHCWGVEDDGPHDFGQLTGIPESGAFVQISAGDSHTCAIDSSGAIDCWGRDNHGQATPPTSGSFVQVDGGGYHTCAVDSSNRVYCWGRDIEGQSSPP